MLLQIGFWKKESGNLMTHSKGLSPEQVETLQSLKPGDRFIIYWNKKTSETTPDYTLKVYSKSEIDNL